MAEARLPMTWGDAQDGDLLDYYRWLIHFRRQHPASGEGTGEQCILTTLPVHTPTSEKTSRNQLS